MARLVKVLLEKQWSDWGPGDIVELEAGQADRVVAKGYGVKATSKAIKAAAKQARVETATAPPAAENADLRPTIDVTSSAGSELRDDDDPETPDDPYETDGPDDPDETDETDEKDGD